MSVSSSFQTLIERIQPLGSEYRQLDSHSGTIKSRLQKQFDVKAFSMIGSHKKGTAIRRTSDVDFLVIFSRDDVRWGGQYIDSRTLINKVRIWLSGLFQQTAIRRDQQALILNYSGGNFAVDVVPGFFENMETNNQVKYPVFSIPDGKGSWLQTSPEMHTRYLVQENERSTYQLTMTIQLIKFWRFTRIPPIPLSSFHLELLLASESVCIGVKSYAQCLAATFNILAQRQCRPLRDPIGISGLVQSTNTELQRADLFKSVCLARDRSFRTVEAEEKGNVMQAKRLWSVIFHNKYPING